MAKPELQCRKAGLADYKAICSIGDDIYDGFDYIPELYQSFCHEKRHRMYIGEIKGKPVVFCYIYMVPNTEGVVIVLSGAARTGGEGEQTGYMKQMGSDLMFPDLQASFTSFRYMVTMNKSPTVDRYMASGMWKVVQKWNSFAYESKRRHLQIFADEERPHKGHRFVVGMTPSGSKMIYSRDYSKIEALVSTYGPMIVHGPAWLIAPMNTKTLREVTLKCSVALTINRGASPLALSIFDSVRCPYGVSGDLFFYGTQMDDLLDHVTYHARRWLKSAQHSSMGLLIHAPMSMDAGKIQDAIKERIGLDSTWECPEQILAEFNKLQ